MIRRLFLGFLLSCPLFGIAQNPPLAHIVLLGDPHLPGKNFNKKEQMLETINQWDDVNMVVTLGDLCEKTGTKEEYSKAYNFFSNLKHPLKPITGNHDFIYEDNLDKNGNLNNAKEEIQKQKLELFKKTFSLKELYYTVEQDPYLLIFLSADDGKKYLAEISAEQLSWLKKTLEENRKKPTIIFFHAPLENTLNTYGKWINTPNFVAQPIEDVKNIILENSQVFLWASGHTHTSFERSSTLPKEISTYKNTIFNLHNSDLNKNEIVTHSLFLYNDKVIIKAYNHTQNKWIEAFERSLSLENLSKKKNK